MVSSELHSVKYFVNVAVFLFWMISMASARTLLDFIDNTEASTNDAEFSAVNHPTQARISKQIEMAMLFTKLQANSTVGQIKKRKHPPGVGRHPRGVGRHPPGVGKHPPGVGKHPKCLSATGGGFFVAVCKRPSFCCGEPRNASICWRACDDGTRCCGIPNFSETCCGGKCCKTQNCCVNPISGNDVCCEEGNSCCK